MASIARPPMASHPSSQSSPPPSPVDTNSPSSPVHHHPLNASTSQPLDINIAVPGLSKAPSRPRLPGRQETPPSPPSSVVLGDHSPISPAMQSYAVSPVSPVKEEHDHQDQTPPQSLKQRITRVFKVGHKRGESDLSRSTFSVNEDATIHQHMPSPLKENESNYSTNSNFYTRQPPATTIRPIAPSNHFNNNSGSTKRRVMNGGEVRVEILPQPGLVVEDPKNYGDIRGTQAEEGDGSTQYYKYYTRSSREAGGEDYGEGQVENQLPKARSESERGAYLPPLNRNTSTIQHSQTNNSHGSGSQERIYVEESVSFGFEGFHIGGGSDHSGGAYAGLSSPASPVYTGGIYSNSGQASSSVLNYMNQSELNILSRNPSSGKSSGAVVRPGISRNASSASYFSPGIRRTSSGPGASSGSIQLDEAVTRELKRLSKISAGSGASGFAMVITADGAASSRLEEGLSDQEPNRIVADRKFTKEEKGKGKAAPSVASESVAERKGNDGQQERGHQHTISDASRFVSGDNHSQNSSDNGDSDGTRELLKGMDGGNPRRKLKSQEVQKGVLVHEGDPRYNFVYRLRQTSDATPILVPQYFYPSDGAFPNRNALTAPTRAKFSPIAPINTSHMSFSGQYGSSPIARPKDVFKRSPDSSGSFYIRMHGGDQAYDSPNGSPRYPGYSSDISDSNGGSMSHSLSEGKMDSLVHPAHRNGGDGPSKRERSRAVLSMGSLEGLAGFGLGRLVTGTPNGTGRRVAGSSLADTSDLSMSHRLEDSPGKRVKRVRMSGIDQISAAPPLAQSNPTAHHGHGESKLPSVPRSGSRLPMRPKILRRSMTPRLYEPRPLGESWKDLADYNPEAPQDEEYSKEYRAKERKAGVIVLALCLLFPPLLLLAAMGVFDTTVDGMTGGEVKGVGKTEKRVAAVVGGLFAIAAVVGGVVAAVLVS